MLSTERATSPLHTLAPEVTLSALIDGAITVFIEPVTDLFKRLTALTTRVAETLINDPITVFIDLITGLLLDLERVHDTLELAALTERLALLTRTTPARLTAQPLLRTLGFPVWTLIDLTITVIVIEITGLIARLEGGDAAAHAALA